LTAYSLDDIIHIFQTLKTALAETLSPAGSFYLVLENKQATYVGSDSRKTALKYFYELFDHINLFLFVKPIFAI